MQILYDRRKVWVVGLNSNRARAKKNKTIGAITIVSSVVIIGVGILLSIGGSSVIIFLLVYGIYLSVHYSRQYDNLMKELEKMATFNPPCPNCGKELPNGNFEFCPFLLKIT